MNASQKAIKDLLAGVHNERLRAKTAISGLLKAAHPVAEKLREHRIKADQKQGRFDIFDEMLFRLREGREENFHSDIIAYLLSPDKAHSLGNEPLFLFIDLLNAAGKNKTYHESSTDFDLIDRTAFNGAVIEREPGRIDILITNQSTNECIIIENKINWAGDQGRQLERYYQKMQKSGHAVRAVVYITPDAANKRPTEQSLGDSADEIKQKLIILPAYPDAEGDTINLNYGWVAALVEYVAKELNDLDLLSFLRQYFIFLEKRRGEFMSEQIAKDLRDLFSTGGTFDAASFEAARTVYKHYPEAMQEFVLSELNAKLKEGSKQQKELLELRPNKYKRSCVFFNFFIKKGEQEYRMGVDLYERDWYKNFSIEIFCREGSMDVGDIREIIAPMNVPTEIHGSRVHIYGWNGISVDEKGAEGLFDTTVNVLKAIISYADSIKPN